MSTPAGEQLPAEQPVIDEIVHIYGSSKAEIYADLASQHPEATPKEIAAQIRQRPTSTATFFYREKNLEQFATKVAPAMVRALGSNSLRIAQVASSTGEEAWSIASLLDAAGIKDFHVRATDINTEALAEAEEGKYPSMLLLSGSQGSRIQEKAAKKFIRNTKTDTLEPNHKLREHVDFLLHDILEGPVPDGPYHVVLVNNMLYHYPEETRDRIMANISRSLMPGGVFVFDNDDGPGHESYVAWAADLEHTHGMQPLALAGQDSIQIRQFKPGLATRAPRLSAREIAQIAGLTGGSALERMAIKVAKCIDVLPSGELQEARESVQAADDMLWLAGGSSFILDSPTEEIRMLLADTQMQLQEVETMFHGSSYNLRSYLADLGIQAGKPE